MDGPSLLKRWRTEVRHISQDEAAKLVDVHQNTWSDWENGNKSPRTEVAMRLDVLTEGLCPIDSWSDDSKLRKQWRATKAAS
jgi:DNA-binding XRE family transcriptional regulator